VELAGVRYAILPENLLHELCRRAGVALSAPVTALSAVADSAVDLELDRAALARRLVLRRRRAGLTQAELARRAGVRVETLNRVERGKTTPDFATIRKLVVAMKQAETELEGQSLAAVPHVEETTDAQDAESRRGD
jgi:DNA-binding XRE family transcriptional regulator